MFHITGRPEKKQALGIDQRFNNGIKDLDSFHFSVCCLLGLFSLWCSGYMLPYSQPPKERVRKIFLPSREYTFFPLVRCAHSRLCAHIRTSNYCQKNSVYRLGYIFHNFRKCGGCLENTGAVLERIKMKDGFG